MKKDLRRIKIVLCLACCLAWCVQHSASAEEATNPQEASELTQQTHEELVKAAQILIEDKQAKLKHLEMDIAKADGQARLADAKVRDLETELAREYVVLKTVLDNLQDCDYDIFLVGRRRYTRQAVYQGITKKEENLRDKERSRQEAEALKLAWQDAAADGRMAIQRINRHLSKAKAKLSEQESRLQQAKHRLATTSIIQDTCPQGDLLLASDTELGQTLSALELEVCTLETLVELRSQSSWSVLDVFVADNAENVSETQFQDKKGEHHVRQKE